MASIARGEQARVLNNTPTKLVIFDDRYAMIPLQAAPAQIVSMILVHRSGLLEALCALFEGLWHQALPLAITPAGPADPDRTTRRFSHIVLAGLGYAGQDMANSSSS